MAAEDFVDMLAARPGAYMVSGNGDIVMCRHPAHVLSDAAIPPGCSWFAE
jgi:hippurate hydrolase